MKTLRYIFLLIVLSASSACQVVDKTITVKFEEDPATPILAYPYTSATIHFSATCAVPVEFKLTGSDMSWNRKYDDESQMSGTITLVFDEGVDESSYFTFRATNGDSKFDVVQDFTFEREEMQNIGTKTFDVDFGGATLDLDFASNSDFEVVIPQTAASWIALEETKAMVDHNVKIIVAANTGLERSAKVTVRSTTSPLSVEYTINQSADLKTFAFTTTATKATLPTFTGTDLAGYVYWTPDVPLKYSAGMTTTYTSVPNTVRVDLVNVASVLFDKLTDITEIDLTKF